MAQPGACDMPIVLVTEKGWAGQGVGRGANASPARGETPAQGQRAGPQSPTPSGLSSGWDFSLWVTGVWHRMGHHAETVGDCGSLLLQSSPCLGTGSAGPSALRMYRPALPPQGAQGPEPVQS